MAARDLLGRLGNGASGEGADASPPEDAPLGGTPAQALHRLQVGLTGLCAMIFVLGVANIVGGQAENAEDAAVPDAAPTTEPVAPPPQRDPLVDAGVVPDIQTEPVAPETEATEGVILSDEDGNVIVPDTPPTELQEPIDEP